MKLIKEVYDSWQAEVVFITSNWQGNKEMMEGCKQAGIPAFVSVIMNFAVFCYIDRYGTRERCGISDIRRVVVGHIFERYALPS
jgi:hypothetical protein